jgi:hypothetical protein
MDIDPAIGQMAAELMEEVADLRTHEALGALDYVARRISAEEDEE